MKVKISILYAWFVRTLTYFLPNFPFIMRFRGFLYSLMMDKCGINFQVTSTTYFNTLSGIKIGDNIYIGHNNVIIGLDITINDEVIIGPNCVISGGNHVFKNGNIFVTVRMTLYQSASSPPRLVVFSSIYRMGVGTRETKLKSND